MADTQNMQTRQSRLRGVELLICLIVWCGVGGLYFVSWPAFQPYEDVVKAGRLNDLLEILENKTLDMRFQWRGKIEPRDDIVIVAVDEKADNELGRWWSSGRRWIARLVDILHEGGARVVGFDLVLDEPDEGAALTAVNEVEAYYRQHTEHDVTIQEQIGGYMDSVKQEHDYDAQLAQAIQRFGHVVLGYYNFISENSAVHLLPEDRIRDQEIITRSKYAFIKVPPGATRGALHVPSSFGTEVNLPIFSDAAKSFGFFNALPHPRDGYIRKAPLIFEYQGEYYPSLAMEIVRASLDPTPPTIIHALGEEERGIISHLSLGNFMVPTDDEGKLLINYYGEGKTFDHYPISDVVLGRIPPTEFRNKIVLLGFTAAIYQDLHPTSFQSGFPGVETHATVIANILDQDFLTRPGEILLFDLLFMFALSLVLGIVLPRTRPVSGALTAILCIAAIIGLAYYAFIAQKIWLNMIYPSLLVITSYVALTSYKYFTEERHKKEVKMAFQHYVAPAVVDQMLGRINQLHLGGERKQLTALFSDIRGFTTISERMNPEELVRFLNEYLSAMTQIVLQYEGTVDKYMGDAIMAFYGAPLEQPDHAVRACKTAIDMIARLKELGTEWQTRDLPPMDIGIGINSGDMSVGNMGSEERFDYTIMGDNVNLASRLEGINKQYGTDIVISQFTYQFIQNQPFTVRELDSVRVKGKREPVTIYELIGSGTASSQMQQVLERFHEGLVAYKRRAWNQAMSQFQKVIELRPEDYPARLYLQRCEEYQQTPPPENWDGVYTMTTK